MRELDEIIVHCAATRPEWMADRDLEDQVAEIRRWHMSPPRNWSDIGYHYIVGRNGRILPGRPIERIGAHVKGRNRKSVGICLIGGHGSAANDKFSDHFTKAQNESLRLLIDNLKTRYPTINLVSAHHFYSAKSCPGFNVPMWLNEKPEEIKAKPKPCVIFKSIRNFLKGE